MADESQPQENVQPSQPPPDPAPEPAPVQADPATIAPDIRLIDVKEFSEQNDAMTLPGDGSVRNDGDNDG